MLMRMSIDRWRPSEELCRRRQWNDESSSSSVGMNADLVVLLTKSLAGKRPTSPPTLSYFGRRSRDVVFAKRPFE